MTRNDQMFGDIEFYQAKKAIKERFEKILVHLQKTVERNGFAVQTVQRFKGCLNITRTQDISRLPFYSGVTFSTRENKIRCVLCLISYAVQEYWDFCYGNKEVKESVEEHLNELSNIAEKGLDAFKIVGAERRAGRYYLEEI